MNEELAAELLRMKEADLALRHELARDGSLFRGYHPRMEELHRQNAGRLREIIAEHGWPGHSLVGEETTDAAWMIVQHDIGEPEFNARNVGVASKASGSRRDQAEVGGSVGRSYPHV